MRHPDDVEEIRKIRNTVLNIYGDAKRRSEVLAALKYDLTHAIHGFNVRFAFDFNVLRPYLFPALDGSYGTDRFYNTLFANDFFFNHGFDLLLLQPYLEELIAFIRYYHTTFSAISPNDPELVISILESRLPFIQRALASATDETEDDVLRRELLVQLTTAVDRGWKQFQHMTSAGAFLSVKDMSIGSGFDPRFRSSDVYKEINLRIQRAKKSKLVEADDENVDIDDITLSPSELRRIERDAEAIYTVMSLNQMALNLGTREFVVFVTQDEVLKQVLDKFDKSWLHSRVESNRDMSSIYAGNSDRVQTWRDTDYLAMYMFLFDEDRNCFLRNVGPPKKTVDGFLSAVEQFDRELLSKWFRGETVSEEITSNVRRAYNAVDQHLLEFDSSSLLGRASLLKAPDVSNAIVRLRDSEPLAGSKLIKEVKRITSKHSSIGNWFMKSVKNLRLVLRELDITLAEFGLKFDERELTFFYPTNLSQDLPPEFLSSAKNVLDLLSELQPSKTAEAIQEIHKLEDRHPDLIETTLLLVRSYFVQGLWKAGHQLTKSLLKREEADSHPELLFTHARLCKKVAPLSGLEEEKLKQESLEYCLRANELTKEVDPRILRELGYLWWSTACPDDGAIPEPVRRDSASSISTPMVPTSDSEFELVSKAFHSVVCARELLEHKDITYTYDVMPLHVTVLNDIAYYRYALNMGRIVSSKCTSNEFATFYSEIVEKAKTDALQALEWCRKLNAKQRRSLFVSSIVDTLARILVAEHDLGMLPQRHGQVDKSELLERLKEAATLVEWCQRKTPSAPCNARLQAAIANSLALEETDPKGSTLKDILTNL